MYTKEEIIQELKRVAAQLGVQTLSERDFERNSMMPASTVRFYLGSWSQALKDAELAPRHTQTDEFRNMEPRNEQDLLDELTRLYNQYGETPTVALLNAKGRYAYKHYALRWKNLNEAFETARTRNTGDSTGMTPARLTAIRDFLSQQEPDMEKTAPPTQINDILPNDAYDDDSDMAQTLPSLSMEDFQRQLEASAFPPAAAGTTGDPRRPDIAAENRETAKNAEQRLPAEPRRPTADSGELGAKVQRERIPGPDNTGGDTPAPTPPKPRRIQLIPETVPPAPGKRSPAPSGEPLHFRGLLFAPVNRVGVAFLFGMIAHELGYVLESPREGPPDFEARRGLDLDGRQWEHLSVTFEYRSSNLKQRLLQGDNPGDLIICWIHDWAECSREILELRRIVPQLSDYRLP